VSRYWDLNSNQLVGSIPASLSALTALRYVCERATLYMTRGKPCARRSTPERCVVTCLPSYWDLHSNRLTGTISDFSTMPHLS
jgi:hypothetical protein